MAGYPANRNRISGTSLLVSANVKGATPVHSGVKFDEERMRPDHWLRSILCVSFSALTLFGWMTGRISSPVPSFKTSGER